MRVMVANSPTAYREVISAVFKELRPHLKVFATDPENLDQDFERLWPQLVVCSRATDLVKRGALAWIELYPGHASESVVSLGGERTTYPEIDFDILLRVLDEAEHLYKII